MGPEVLGQLVDEQAAALTLYARQWCRTPEDVVQEAFLKLVAQKRPPEHLVPWLYRVVRNGAISAARAAERRRRHESAAARQAAWFVETDNTALDGETAAAALQTLPLDQREVLVAQLWGGLTFAQIGELMGTSSTTAHRLYVAGLKALRERLRVPCPPKPPIRS
jgi:RNA polymerase sigma-70 factor (ECF subfamily)